MNDTPFVYADCAASAPVLPVVRDEAVRAFANPNSVHRDGRIARGFLERAREDIAESINASPYEIAFTPSATAACRFAAAELDMHIPSPHDHKSLYDECVTRSLIPRPAGHEKSAVRSQILASNETGEIFADRIRKMTRSGLTVFTDATAAVGQIPVNVRDLGVVGLAAGAHKFGGLPGIGFLYLRGGIKDSDTYPGTPPVGLAWSMACALRHRVENMGGEDVELREKTDALAKVLSTIPGAVVNCYEKERLPNIVSVRFDGVNARELLSMLDANGVRASAGSACTADIDAPSRPLMAAGLTEEQALSTVRLSFCPETSVEDLMYVAQTADRCVRALRNLTTR